MRVKGEDAGEGAGWGACRSAHLLAQRALDTGCVGGGVRLLDARLLGALLAEALAWDEWEVRGSLACDRAAASTRCSPKRLPSSAISSCMHIERSSGSH